MGMMKPGVAWPAVHREVYRVLLTHLAAIGIVRCVSLGNAVLGCAVPPP
jgi:hypothetical protein